jgi:FkbM family methyltransferase
MLFDFQLLGSKLHLSGASPVKKSSDENSFLRLNRNYELGPRGTIVKLPKDKVIFESVKRSGRWEPGETQFLAESLKNSCEKTKPSEIALIDIGANVGLVSLAAMNIAKTKNEVILFEPIPKHMAALKHNLSKLQKQTKVIFFECALGDQTKFTKMFTESSNSGNSSILKEVVPKQDRDITRIKIVETNAFLRNKLRNYKKIVLKCDIQGFEAQVISKFPKFLWAAVDYAVIEIWAIPKLNKPLIEKACIKLSKFNYLSWDYNFNEIIDIEEVRDFWMSETNQQRNLFVEY